MLQYYAFKLQRTELLAFFIGQNKSLVHFNNFCNSKCLRLDIFR